MTVVTTGSSAEGAAVARQPGVRVVGLDRRECLRLLGDAGIGRVGITVGALPVVLPVRFAVVDAAVVFRTGLATTLDAATRGTVVAFEASEIDVALGTGWSVAVTDVARPVTDPDDRLGHALPRWGPGVGALRAIATERITGRRLI